MIAITGMGVNTRKGSVISGCRQHGLEVLRWTKLDNGFREAFLEKREQQRSKAGDHMGCKIRDTRGGFEIGRDL